MPQARARALGAAGPGPGRRAPAVPSRGCWGGRAQSAARPPGPSGPAGWLPRGAGLAGQPRGADAGHQGTVPLGDLAVQVGMHHGHLLCVAAAVGR